MLCVTTMNNNDEEQQEEEEFKSPASVVYSRSKGQRLKPKLTRSYLIQSIISAGMPPLSCCCSVLARLPPPCCNQNAQLDHCTMHHLASQPDLPIDRHLCSIQSTIATIHQKMAAPTRVLLLLLSFLVGAPALFTGDMPMPVNKEVLRLDCWWYFGRRWRTRMTRWPRGPNPPHVECDPVTSCVLRLALALSSSSSLSGNRLWTYMAGFCPASVHPWC